MKKYHYNIFDDEEPDEQLIKDAIDTFQDKDEYQTYHSCLEHISIENYTNDDIHMILLFLYQSLLHQRLVNQDLQNQIDEIRIQQQYQDGTK